MKKYRMLKPGEVIQEGDENFRDGKWSPVSGCIGYYVYRGNFRRPIPKVKSRLDLQNIIGKMVMLDDPALATDKIIKFIQNNYRRRTK